MRAIGGQQIEVRGRGAGYDAGSLDGAQHVAEQDAGMEVLEIVAIGVAGATVKSRPCGTGLRTARERRATALNR